MIRLSSITVFLLIVSMLVACAQPTQPMDVHKPTLEPTPTIVVKVTLTETLTDFPNDTPIMEPVNGEIQFAGRIWNVKSGCGLGPGPNCWSDSAESVWVQVGQLHLKIRKIEDQWHSAEVTTLECSQYGIHRFFISSELDSFDKNVVAAVFLYKDDQNEIDIEFSKWTEENSEENAQYLIQPWNIPGNIHRFDILPDITESTHSIDWGSSSIQFQSIRGHLNEPPSVKNLLNEWIYSGANVPNEDDCLRVHINLWQVAGIPPSDDQEVELVVTDAQLPDAYQPPPTSIPSTSISPIGPSSTPLVRVTSADTDSVSGLVDPETYCNDNYRVVIYAKTDIWYVQPFTVTPLTIIAPESCYWEAFTHPWNELAVFLVPSNYEPPATLRSQFCPPNLPGVELLASDCFHP